MSEIIKENNMSIILECAERQLCANQDIAMVLTIDEEEGKIKEFGDQPIDIVAVLDGHGHNLVVDIIREENMYVHFAKSNPAESLQNVIDLKIPIKKAENNKINYVSGTSYRKYMKSMIIESTIYSSGATLSFAKIYRNTTTKKMKIIAEWIGDSPIIIFINDELVFKSELHNVFNDLELKRLKEKGLVFNIENHNLGFKILDENIICNKPSKYIVFNNNDKVMMAFTRSLGHNRITGVDTQKHTIECSTDDEVKILVFTDGVDDVLNMDIDLEKLKTCSSEELVEFAEKRWKKIWNYNGTITKFPSNGYDDCSCAIWYQKKITI